MMAAAGLSGTANLAAGQKRRGQQQLGIPPIKLISL
jgi:hypothetical protein